MAIELRAAGGSVQLTSPKYSGSGGAVNSVNGMKGDVILTAADVRALPADTVIPSIEGLATEQYVDNAIDGIGIPDVDLSDYALKTEIPDVSDFATKEEIPDVSSFITKIPDEYVTEAELNAKGYQTEENVIALISQYGGGGSLPASEEGKF